MRNIIAACFFVIITCAGCGDGAYWYNKEKTYQRAKTDCLQCLYNAEGEIMEASMQEEREYGNSPDVHETYRQTIFEKCMKDKGYALTKDYKLDYYIRKGFVTHDDETYPVAGK